MEKLKRLLAAECDFKMSDQLMDEFLKGSEELELKRNEVLIMAGQYDPNIYLVKDGVIRYSYMDGLKETTFAFALPGSILIAMHCVYAHLPAFYQMEACCKSTIIRIPHSHYEQLIKTSHEFTQWALRYSQGQIFHFEKKNCVVNGDTRERFISIIENRPEIINKVALKHIASYLGVTLQYLSKLKREVKKQIQF